MLKFARMFLVAMLAIGATLGSVAAQPVDTETVFTATIGDLEVDLGSSGAAEFIVDDYRLREVTGITEEYIWFTNGYANYELVLIESDNITADEYTEITLDNMISFYDTFEVVAEDGDDSFSTFSGVAELDGQEMEVFYAYEQNRFDNVSVVVMIFTGPQETAANIEWMQENVTVGGEDVLDYVTVETNTADDEAESTVEATDEVDEDEGSSDDNSASSGLLDRLSNTNEATNEEEIVDDEADGTDEDADATDDVDATAAAEGDWESLGLVSDTEWVSPQYGTTVSWDGATWYFPDDYEYAIVSNTDRKYDLVTLQTTDGLGYVYVTVDTIAGNSPEAQIEWWTSAEYAETWTNEIEVLDTRTTEDAAAVVIRTTNSRGQDLLVIYNYQELEDGTGVWSEISAAPDTLGDVSEQYIDGVEVNGSSVDLVYTPEELEEFGAE